MFVFDLIDIISTSPDSGIIEAIPDTISLDSLKKNDPHFTTLADFFERVKKIVCFLTLFSLIDFFF